MKVSKDPMMWAWATSIVCTLLIGLSASREHLPLLFPDSADYYLDTYYLKLGYPGTIRTPGLPILAGVLGYWWGMSVKEAYFNVMVLSVLVWIFSVRCFGKAALGLTDSRITAAACMIAFGCYPSLIRMAYFTLAESLCISLSAILIYQLTLCLRRKSLQNIIGVGVWVLCLILLKPIFIILLPLLGILGAVFFVKHYRSQSFAAMGVMAVLVAGVFAYSEWWKATYGFRAISMVNTINNTALACETGILQLDDFTHPQTRAVFQPGKSNKECVREILWMEWECFEPGNPVLVDCNNAVNKAIRRANVELIPYFVNRFWKMAGAIPADITPRNLQLFKFLRIGMLIPMMLLTLLFAKRASRKLWVRAVYVIAALITLAWIGVIWIGAEADWGRLFLPAWSWLVIGTLGAVMGIKNWYEAR